MAQATSNGGGEGLAESSKISMAPKERVRAIRPAKAPKRRKGIVAEESQLRARVELARALGDPAEERVAAHKLSEILGRRDAEIDYAVELAFRTLSSQDDPSLRHSLAGWLESLGEPGLAASELRKLASVTTGVEAASVFLRIGVLHARAGDAVGAHEALSDAAERDTSDALPLELLGAVAGWAAATHGGQGIDLDVEGFPGPRVGAEAYVRAAHRRSAAREDELALENLLRAFELDPSSPTVAAALVDTYTKRAREDAADQVRKAHAAALSVRGDSRTSASVHAQRRSSALEIGQLSRALGAALDERLDGAFEGTGADAFDDLLARVGAYEPLAVRLEMRAEREKGRAAAERWAALGRLLSGPVAAADRALPIFARAVAADASNAETIRELRALCQKSGDMTWLVEGLVRAVMGAAAYGSLEDNGARLAAAHQLASIGEEKNDALLSAWAYRVMSELDPSDERARAASGRLEGIVRRREEELDAARKTLEVASGAEREAALFEFVRLSRDLPDVSREYARVVLELAEIRRPGGFSVYDEDAIFVEALRAAERVGEFDGIARLVEARLTSGGPNVRLRGHLVSALRREGSLKAAAAAARVFAEESATRWTCSVAWITAAAAHDELTRGRALAAAAPTCGNQVVATIAAVAAEVLAEAGEIDVARRAAEQAYRADKHNVRALLVFAKLASTSEGRVAQAAVERAMESAWPSAFWCARLSDILAEAGDARGAVSWARRRVALRPGDPVAAQALVDRAVLARDAGALEEALAWLAPQPQPTKEMAERLTPALEALGELDPGRAAAIARRALDVLGPRHATLRLAMERVTEAGGDLSLRTTLAERWIAAGAPAAERGPLLLELATLYRRLGDLDAEVSAYARAAREGVGLSEHASRIDELTARPMSPDTELAFLEVCAELRLDQGDVSRAADAFRDLGAALWDMADDRPRAVQAWVRSAQCDSVYGYDTLRRDLAEFADAQYSVDCLSELVEREGDRVRSGIIATQAARAALDVGAYARAFNLAKIALERDPGHADALETAEAACTKLARVPEMSTIYDQVARRARGRFGRRAAHHRAARFFESSGINMMALKHAAQAFIAVPSEGSTLSVLQRTALRAQRASVAVRTVEHVAELARSPSARAAWLLRAASMTASSIEGTRQKVDLLLKAAVIVPSPTTLSMLAVAARELVSLAPDDTAAVALRLERACDQLAKDLEGPDGARIAITFVEMAMDLFSDGSWGWRSLERAIGADADVDEYASLVRFSRAFSQVPSAAEALSRVTAEIEKPYSNVGHALLRLVGAIFKEVGDPARTAKLLVRAVEKESDDDVLVVEADEAVKRLGDELLLERLTKKVGVFRRTEALRALAKKAVEKGDAGSAVTMLERAAGIATSEQKADVAKELNEALVAAGRGEDAVLRELARADMPKPERALRWAELARIREERGDMSGAADALLQAATDEPTPARWTAVERVAEASGREHIRVDALQQLASLARAGDSRVELRTVLKRLARAEGARGSLAAAESAWREVMDIDPSDTEADVAIEALLVARGSYDDLVDHLAERANRLVKSSAPEDKDKLRAVRLRRAAILEQRLSRLEEACVELEQVLVEHPSHPSALRWLADLYERAGEPSRALPALERLFSAANEELEYVSVGVRRVRALAASGDVDKAREAMGDLRARAENVLSVAEARVDVARAAKEPRELGDALAALARISVDEPRIRSEMLVEAAQAAARAADSETSLARAREAARLAPDVASTQLFARGLEYRLRGAGTKDDALATIASLERLDGNSADDKGQQNPLEPEDVALRAFLLAEAEDVAHGSNAGEKTLRRALEQVGAQPLVALGLAERAAKADRHEEAYRFYTEAVYGNLLGLRRPGHVALAAADSASLAGDLSSTQRFLNEAAKDPETRMEALRRVARVALSRDDTVKARSVLRGLAEALAGSERAEILAELARALLSSASPSDRLEGDRTMREAIDVAPAALATALRSELESFRGRPPPQATPPAEAAAPPPDPPAPRGANSPPADVASKASESAAIAAPASATGEPTKDSSKAVKKPGTATIPAGTSEWSTSPSVSAEREESVREEVRAMQRLSVEIPGIPKIPPAPPPLLVTPDDAIPSVRHPPLGTSPPPPAPVNEPVEEAPAERTNESPSAPAMEIPTTPSGKVAKARARLVHGSREEAEKLLTEALSEGSIDAADLLDRMLGDEPSRRGALLKIRRQAVELNPGNIQRLTALRDAARADQNANYVRAIEHVLRAVDPAEEPLSPPPLMAQNGQPGMLTLLSRHSHEPEGEAFGIVWEGASAMFAKSPAAAKMADLERVIPGPTTALSRLYEATLRLLDTPRFSLFQRRAMTLSKPRKGELAFEEEGASPSFTVALLSPPAAILEGDTREDSLELRWVLGQALSSVLPQSALVLGLPVEEARALWTAVLGAFGPPGLVMVDRKDAHLADMLWQTLAPRTQRQLKELLSASEATAFELVLERAKQSGRRVGMFVTGDFGHAARTVLTDFPEADPADLQRPGGLERLCARLPALADLLRLAVRPEYADARWHLPTQAAQRLAPGRLRPV